jgi:hypothetical protein
MKGIGNMYNPKELCFGLMVKLAKKENLDLEVIDSYKRIVKENPKIDQHTACRYAMDDWDIIY